MPAVFVLAWAAGLPAGLAGAQDALPDSSSVSPMLPAAPPAHPAEDGGRTRERAGIEPLDIGGRSFHGVRMPGAVQATDVSLAAARAWVWTEGGGAAAGDEPTQRLLLQGDVRITMGVYRFTAARAVVWIQRLPTPPGATGGAGAAASHQVAVYFDRVSDPGAEAGVAQAADRLLVTGVVMGELGMSADSVRRERPAMGPAPRRDEGEPGPGAFLREAEARLARHLRSIVGGQAAGLEGGAEVVGDAGAYDARRPIRPGVSRPYEPDSPITRTEQVAAAPPAIGEPTDLPPAERVEPIFAESGIFTFAVNTRTPGAGDPDAPDGSEEQPIRVSRGAEGEENTVVLTGGVVVQYTDVKKAKSLQLSAQRAVMFLRPGPLTDLGGFEKDVVRGVYLEGDVLVTNGSYTLRAPRVYYDVQNDRAVIVDAVFWTYDPVRGLPLYVRAKEIRQVAANQWTAAGARLAISSFLDPMFSIGTTSVTITQRDRPGGGGGGNRDGDQTIVDARNVTLRAGGVPFFWLPRYKGDPTSAPLRDLRLENSSSSGTALKTGWDIFGLAGVEAPAGVRSDLLLDFYFDRGPAVGNRSTWSEGRQREGQLFLYTLPIDFGEDSLSSGAERGRDHEFRGLFLGEHREELDEDWTLFLEGSFVSDENFVDAFFKPLAYEGRELTNQAYLRHLDDNAEFQALARGSFNDFTVNQYLLSSQGYTVEKLPELGYYRLADDLFDQWKPGLLTWSHEYRLSRMSLNFTEPTADELGFDTRARVRDAFGFDDPNRSIADQLRAGGYTEDGVLRFDTRQELATTFDLEPVRFTPFVAGRFTGYDDDFEEFNSGTGEAYRGWWAAGVRASTELVRVNDLIDSSLFDLHRTRHVVEPNVTAWSAGSNVGQNDLPVYDDAVESIGTGSAVKMGVNQTWQTQRGGPGRWRSVDVLKLNTELVLSSGDADRHESPIKRFFDYRPEYSLLGDFASVEAAWQLTDVVGLTADHIYDLDIDQPARTSVGAIVQHSPEFSTYGELRYLNVFDTTFINFGATYQLTRRYSFSASTTYDTDRGDFQSYYATIKRRVPEANLGLSFGYSNITDESSIGFIFEPVVSPAPGGNADRLRNLGR